METDAFGYIVVWTIYTSHTDHFTHQHTAFELSAACLSIVFGFLVLFRLQYCGIFGEFEIKCYHEQELVIKLQFVSDIETFISKN